MYLLRRRLKCVFYILAVISFMIFFMLTVKAGEVKDGTLVLSNNDGGSSCTIPFVSGTYNFKDNGGGHGCKNDDKSMLGLNDVPSATTVFLSDTPDCNKKTDQNYWIEFKTIKQPTNVQGLSFSKFFTKSNGEVVVAGVRLLDSYHRHDDTLQGKLSCVKITRSAVP